MKIYHVFGYKQEESEEGLLPASLPCPQTCQSDVIFLQIYDVCCRKNLMPKGSSHLQEPKKIIIVAYINISEKANI